MEKASDTIIVNYIGEIRSRYLHEQSWHQSACNVLWPFIELD
uniref:Uncharacterized protein n=1 Tax=Pseudomonas syringae TaxID=317 RepID=I3W0D8_PSESX|nr:hypothetical protein [Pseudomonas syringae]